MKGAIRHAKSKVLAILLVAAMAFALLAGCSGSGGNQNRNENTREFTDSAGREVMVPEEIERVAVTGPLAQITVFAIAPDEMVALASDWSDSAHDYIDEKYLDLPKLGQLYGGNGDLNEEELLKVDPDVIIDVGEAKETIVEDMDQLQDQTGIPTVHITATLAEMDKTYEMLGELLGLEDKAAELSEYCRTRYDRAEEMMEEVGDEEVSAIYCLEDFGTNVICKGSYFAEVMDLLTDNVAVVDNPSSRGTGNEVSMEQIYNWDPEVIIFGPDSYYDYVADDPTWADLQAVQSGRYYEVPYAVYNWMGFPPSVQRFLGLEWLSEVLYPEYCDFDLYEEIDTFFEEFLHCEITEEEFDALMEKSVDKVEEAE